MSQGIPQSSFAAGELSPSLAARIDLDRYHIGLRTARNGFILREGGFSSRPGSKYVASVKTIASPVRLIPFIFNTDQTYVLEFGNLYMRVYQNGGVVIDPGTNLPAEIVTPYAQADLFDLQYVQSADVITIVHQKYAPRELRRTDHWAWALTTIAFTPLIGTPTSLAITYYTAGSESVNYKVTAIDPDTGQESAATASVGHNVSLDTTWTNRVVLTWNSVDAPSGTACKLYNVYRRREGSVYGFIGQASIASYTDRGDNAAYEITPLDAKDPFPSSDWPSCVAYHQQRLVFANTPARTQTVLCSQVGNYHDFRASEPPQADDAIEFTMATNQANPVRWLAALRVLVAGTSGAEYAIGRQGEAFTPATISANPQSYTGASSLAPLIVGNSALFVQNMGAFVHALSYEFQSDAYVGPDLCIFSTHLFRGYTILDWCYAKTPFLLVWAVRSDGVLLCLTYLRDQDVVAWTHCDTDGEYISLCSVPEGSEDAVYCCVKRTLNGVTTHTIERFASRLVTTSAEFFGVDCGLLFDGRNAKATTMHVAGLAGTDSYVVGSTPKLTSSVALVFDSTWLDDVVELTYDGVTYAGVVVYVHVDYFVTIRLLTDMPASTINVETAVWTRKTRHFAGADHLANLECAVLADGSVHPPVTIAADGTFSLANRAGVVAVGLPYTATMETLGVAIPNSDLRTRKKVIRRVTVDVVDSRGFACGPDADHLSQPKWRQSEPMGSPDELKSQQIEVYPATTWSILGRVVVQQSDPLPLTVVAVTPEIEPGG